MPNLNLYQNSKPKILTWHIHGSYLYYLSQADCELYLPVKKERPEGYGGKVEGLNWGNNVHEVEADKVKSMKFDCILYQSPKNYLKDKFELLDDDQIKNTPQIYLEHNPPRKHPTNTRHIADNQTLIVHVTHFNKLMWDAGNSPTKVIEHGVIVPEDASYVGKKKKGVVVVNNLKKRGRRLGLDVFKQVRKHVPLDLVGMGSKEIGGLGEIKHKDLPYFISQYRFFFNPIRYTSMGLSVCEAMMVGLPVVGLATTEMPVNVKNNKSGFIHTNIEFLTDKMKLLLRDKETAERLGNNSKKYAQKQFSINRFISDWNKTFQQWITQAKHIRSTQQVIIAVGGAI